MSVYQTASLHINHEPVRVYVFQGRVPLHCGVCGKRLLPGDEYTRHQSPTRWSLSGHVFDDVEIGLRRTSIKSYTACAGCYGFTYDQDKPAFNTDAMEFVRLNEMTRTGELIFDDVVSATPHTNTNSTMEEDYEDMDATLRVRAITEIPIWKQNTTVLETPYIAASSLIHGTTAKQMLNEFINEGAGEEWLR